MISPSLLHCLYNLFLENMDLERLFKVFCCPSFLLLKVLTMRDFMTNGAVFYLFSDAMFKWPFTISMFIACVL